MLPRRREGKRRKTTQQLKSDASSPDRVDAFATMYPTFWTAPIPAEVGRRTLATSRSTYSQSIFLS